MGRGRRRLLSREGRVELYVVMARGSDGNETAREWIKRLEQEGIGQGGADLRVRAASAKKVIVSLVPDGEAEATALAWIAQQPQALWVGAKERFKSRNKWAKGVMQSGRAQATPLWDKGIKGEGQIVGIADTGIQHDLCYFHDPSYRVPFNRLDLKHRKIIYYKYEQGWGSKVCVIISASPGTLTLQHARPLPWPLVLPCFPPSFSSSFSSSSSVGE